MYAANLPHDQLYLLWNSARLPVMQSGALDENLLPDVTVFELDLEEDSDEEILFAKAMPVR